MAASVEATAPASAATVEATAPASAATVEATAPASAGPTTADNGDWWVLLSKHLQDALQGFSNEATATGSSIPDKAALKDVDWRARLTSEEHRVLREKGTEEAGSGEYDRVYPVDGYFVCRGCANPLFSAAAKFKSGCGWPSFDRCYVGSVTPQADTSHGDRRVELVCSLCDGHLGHLFTGEKLTELDQRHCVNSLSIKLVKQPPPAHLVERGEMTVDTAAVDKQLAVLATASDGKLANVRPQSDLDMSDPELAAAWEATRAAERGWCLCTYAADSKTRIVPSAHGADGFAGLRRALLDEAVNYGVLPCRVDGRDRHVFFCYVGESTSGLKRGRAAMHAPHIEKYFGGTVGMLSTLTAAEELEPAHVDGLLRALCKGAAEVHVL